MYMRSQERTFEHTYFNYSVAETTALEEQSSSLDINSNDVYFWDQKVFRLVSNNKIGDVDASRIYAYLAIAQRDFAVLSYNATGNYEGSINSVSQKVLCTFFADDCTNLSIDEPVDELSAKISGLVMKRVAERIAQDTVITKPTSLAVGKDLWSGLQPSIGIDAMNRLPWYLATSDQFRVAPPPNINSDAGKQQLQQTKSALANITDEQRDAVVFWAGGPGTKTPPGIWLNVADQYMKDNDTDLPTVLSLHADLTTSMADAVIAVFDSKYAHLQKRPFMMDGTISTVMPTPNHPSFPSGHATISGAANIILAYYFPENKTYWLQTAEETSNTRLWGGIHFPIDNSVGLDLGEKIGNRALEHLK